jgi:hypothetical protein
MKGRMWTKAAGIEPGLTLLAASHATGGGQGGGGALPGSRKTRMRAGPGVFRRALFCGLIGSCSLFAGPATAADPTPIERVKEVLAIQDAIFESHRELMDFVWQHDWDSAKSVLDVNDALRTDLEALLTDPFTGQVFGSKEVATRLKLLERARAAAARQRTIFENAASTALRRFKAERATLGIDAKSDKRFFKSVGPLLMPAHAGDHIILEELRSRGAGFHKPKDKVCFRVDGLRGKDGSVCDDAQIDYISSGDANAIIASRDDHRLSDTGVFCLRMGGTRGGVGIRVTACGKTSTRGLYNYGTAKFPVTSGGGKVSAYDGTYSGRFSGALVCPIVGVTQQYDDDGTFLFALKNGLLEPFVGTNATGTVSADGVVSLHIAVSDVGEMTFTGTITNGEATGTWTAPSDNCTWMNATWHASRR